MVQTVKNSLDKLQKEKECLEVLIAIKDAEIELFKNYYLGDMTKEEYDKKMEVLRVLKRTTEFIRKINEEK